MIVGLCSMFSYVFADMVGLSGVMSIFFCAIVLAHRNYWNLSIEGQLVVGATADAIGSARRDGPGWRESSAAWLWAACAGRGR